MHFLIWKKKVIGIFFIAVLREISKTLLDDNLNVALLVLTDFDDSDTFWR